MELQQQLRECTTPTVHYAAFHGVKHITSSLHAVEVIQDLRKFFESKLLNWIELIGWYQKVSIFMRLIHDLKTCIEATLSSTELLVSMNSSMRSGAQMITVSQRHTMV